MASWCRKHRTMLRSRLCPAQVLFGPLTPGTQQTSVQTMSVRVCLYWLPYLSAVHGGDFVVNRRLRGQLLTTAWPARLFELQKTVRRHCHIADDVLRLMLSRVQTSRWCLMITMHPETLWFKRRSRLMVLPPSRRTCRFRCPPTCTGHRAPSLRGSHLARLKRRASSRQKNGTPLKCRKRSQLIV